MSPFLRIPLGFFVMVVGFFMVAKTAKFMSWFGRIPFAEDKFGPGGSYFFYKVLGTSIMFLGIAIVTNLIHGILTSLACILTYCQAN